MFTDPVSITLNGTTKNLPRVSSQGKTGVYQNSDGTLVMTISHQEAKGNRLRSQVRIDQSKVVSEPVATQVDTETCSFYVVLDRPKQGFSENDVNQLIASLKIWLNDAAITKIYGQES